MQALILKRYKIKIYNTVLLRYKRVRYTGPHYNEARLWVLVYVF